MNLSFFRFGDRHDQVRATRLRAEYGRRGWLVSWHRGHRRGAWMARLSCPEFPQTIERLGRSRCMAIDLAAEVLDTYLAEV